MSEYASYQWTFRTASLDLASSRGKKQGRMGWTGVIDEDSDREHVSGVTTPDEGAIARPVGLSSLRHESVARQGGVVWRVQRGLGLCMTRVVSSILAWEGLAGQLWVFFLSPFKRFATADLYCQCCD